MTKKEAIRLLNEDFAIRTGVQLKYFPIKNQVIQARVKGNVFEFYTFTHLLKIAYDLEDGKT